MKKSNSKHNKNFYVHVSDTLYDKVKTIINNHPDRFETFADFTRQSLGLLVSQFSEDFIDDKPIIKRRMILDEEIIEFIHELSRSCSTKEIAEKFNRTHSTMYKRLTRMMNANKIEKSELMKRNVFYTNSNGKEVKTKCLERTWKIHYDELPKNKKGRRKAIVDENKERVVKCPDCNIFCNIHYAGNNEYQNTKSQIFSYKSPSYKLKNERRRRKKNNINNT